METGQCCRTYLKGYHKDGDTDLTGRGEIDGRIKKE